MAKIADTVIKVEDKDVVRAKKNLDKASKSSRDANKDFKVMGKTFTLSGKSMASAAAVLGTALVALTKKSVDYLDTIDKTSTKLGISTDALQEYRFAASQTGVAQATIDMSLQRFARRLGEAADGTGVLKDVLKEYNIEIRDSNGKMRRTEDILMDYADVIQNATSAQEKLTIANKAFDSEGVALVNTMRNGSEGLEEFARQAREAGIVIDSALIEKAVIASDKWDLFDKKLKAVGSTIGLFFADAMFDLRKESERAGHEISILQREINELEKAGRKSALGRWLSGTTEEEIKSKREEIKKLQETIIRLNIAASPITPTTPRTPKEGKFVADPAQVAKEKAQADFIATVTADTERMFELDKMFTDQATELKIAAIDDEMMRLIAFNNFKQEQAFEEIQSLKVEEQEKQDLRDQFIENRVTGEIAAAERIKEANKNAFERIAENYNDTTQVMTDMGVQWTNQLGDGITDAALTGANSFNAMRDSIIRDIFAMIVKQQLFNMLAGITGGGTAASAPVGGSVEGTGNVNIGFTAAKGTVLSGNTSIAGGTAGEAGPEGLLPLKRDRHGNLGVITSGGSNQGAATNITIINNTKAEITTEESLVDGEKMIKVMVEDAIGSMTQNGRFDKVMSVYGGSRRGTR